MDQEQEEIDQSIVIVPNNHPFVYGDVLLFNEWWSLWCWWVIR